MNSDFRTVTFYTLEDFADEILRATRTSAIIRGGVVRRQITYSVIGFKAEFRLELTAVVSGHLCKHDQPVATGGHMGRELTDVLDDLRKQAHVKLDNFDQMVKDLNLTVLKGVIS